MFHSRKRMISLLVLALAFPSAGHSAAFDNLNFRVWLGDREIGQHSYTFSQQGPLTNVLSKVNYNVKVLFVSVFKYKHEAAETWMGNCLTAINSFTVENGEETVVEGHQEGGNFIVQRNDQTLTEASDCMGTYAYWDPTLIQRDALMNSQTGEVDPAQVRDLGEKPMPRLNLDARTYQIDTEQASIQLWYSNEGDWLALETETNGRQLVYLNESLLQ